MNSYELDISIFREQDTWMWAIIQEGLWGNPEVLGHGQSDNFDEVKRFVADAILNL
jgi:hypothetical protein